MANMRLIFQGTERTNTHEVDLECFINTHEEITVSIKSDNTYPEVISLDVSTAIKFAKTLRTLINEVKEVSND